MYVCNFVCMHVYIFDVYRQGEKNRERERDKERERERERLNQYCIVETLKGT